MRGRSRRLGARRRTYEREREREEQFEARHVEVCEPTPHWPREVALSVPCVSLLSRERDQEKRDRKKWRATKTRETQEER